MKPHITFTNGMWHIRGESCGVPVTGIGATLQLANDRFTVAAYYHTTQNLQRFHMEELKVAIRRNP